MESHTVPRKLLEQFAYDDAITGSKRLRESRHFVPWICAVAESKAGHGAGKPVTKQIEEFTDVYSFLFWQLGVK
jgi:prolyl oligopeptidase PreP (S9A serine peptidase family)